MIEWHKFIPKGESNAIPACDLVHVLGVADERALRKVIEQARREGLVLCSSAKGYFFPVDLYELQSYVARQTRRAQTTFRCLQSARKMLREMDGQQTIGGVFDEVE